MNVVGMCSTLGAYVESSFDTCNRQGVELSILSARAIGWECTLNFLSAHAIG